MSGGDIEGSNPSSAYSDDSWQYLVSQRPNPFAITQTKATGNMLRFHLR